MASEIKDKKILRNSSIELLRIISMIMIVLYHVAFHSGIEWNANSITIPHFWYNFIIMGGKIGVDVFVLISGYYLIYDHGVKVYIKRILKIWLEIFFYSILFYLITVLIGDNKISINTIVAPFMPVTYSQWWFANTYVVLLVVHPFLNKLLLSMSKKEYQMYLIVIIFAWSVIPTITGMQNEGSSLVWFIVMYSISAYIRIYNLKGINNSRKQLFQKIIVEQSY